MVASATVHTGIAFSQEQTVETALSRVASLTETPKAHAVESAVEQKVVRTPKLKRPASGLDWGDLHAHNGVDIANTCGTAVIAAADGRVVSVESGWNGGYGNAVLIRHGGGIDTYYAHLTKAEVAEGDAVQQGETIGTMGETGKATGCHLHFEVHGGTNPFGK
jgi:murein DD-endopeptidase MepM/ murein hydrolase activator NlpD